MEKQLEWIKHLKTDAMKTKKYSQCGEDIILKRIFNAIGTTNKFLVDFGAGDGFALSNSRLFIEEGWQGLLMDGDNQGNTDVKEEFITAENICELFAKYNVPKEFDFLSIDIDGNDYWVLNAILKGGYSGYSPRVIIAEFNGTIANGISKTIKYNPTHKWGNNDYYGFSFDAGKKLATQHGYTLVCQSELTNMVFVRSDIVPDTGYGVNYKPMQYHAHTDQGEWVNV